jgi:hypothetical protein
MVCTIYIIVHIVRCKPCYDANKNFYIVPILFIFVKPNPFLMAYKIVTMKGLDEQVLLDGSIQLDSVNEPSSSMEKKLFDKFLTLKRDRMLIMGYNDTYVYIPGADLTSPITSFDHFFMAETLSKIPEVHKASSIIDLDCGMGFLGNYAAKHYAGSQDGLVVFVDNNEQALNLVINAYLMNNALLPHNDALIQKKENGIIISGKGNQVLEVICGSYDEELNGYTAEIAVACPFYLPRIAGLPEDIFTGYANAAKKISANLYICHTSLADTVIAQAAKETGAMMTVVASKKSPFHIGPIDLRYIDAITDDDGTIGMLEQLGLMIEGEGKKRTYSHEVRLGFP